MTQLGSVKGAAEWLLAPAPEALLPSVTQQGSSLATKWHYEGGAFDPAEWQIGFALLERRSGNGTAVNLAGSTGAWADRALANHCQSIRGGDHDWSSGQPGAGPFSDSRERLNGCLVNQARRQQTPRRKAGRWFEVLAETLMRLSPATLRMAQARCLGWRFRLALRADCMSGWEFSGIGRIHFHSISDAGESTGHGPDGAKPAQLGIEVGNIPEFKTDVLQARRSWFHRLSSVATRAISTMVATVCIVS